MYYVALNPEALVYALAQQPESLPAELQISLTAIGLYLETNPNEELALELRELIRSYEALELAYQKEEAALGAVRRFEKSVGIDDSTLFINIELIGRVFRSNDWVESAKLLYAPRPFDFIFGRAKMGSASYGKTASISLSTIQPPVPRGWSSIEANDNKLNN